MTSSYCGLPLELCHQHLLITQQGDEVVQEAVDDIGLIAVEWWW